MFGRDVHFIANITSHSDGLEGLFTLPTEQTQPEDSQPAQSSQLGWKAWFRLWWWRARHWDPRAMIPTEKLQQKGDLLVNSSQLGWKDRSRFWWWRGRHWDYRIKRPRATWSQVLLAFGITDTKSITRGTVDADSIPSTIDVPVQRIRLFELGMLALSLGFTSVSLDTTKRSFKAIGPFATISTEEVPGFGKVIRFEGDILKIHSEISRCTRLWLLALPCYANGKLRFGRYDCNGLFLPLGLLTDAIHYDDTVKEYEKKEKDAIQVLDEEAESGGNIPGEALLFHRTLSSLLRDNMRDLHSAESPVSRCYKLSDGLSSNIAIPHSFQRTYSKRPFSTGKWTTSMEVCMRR
jgi:hypothetical protein